MITLEFNKKIDYEHFDPIPVREDQLLNSSRIKLMKKKVVVSKKNELKYRGETEFNGRLKSYINKPQPKDQGHLFPLTLSISVMVILVAMIILRIQSFFK